MTLLHQCEQSTFSFVLRDRSFCHRPIIKTFAIGSIA